MGNRRFEMYEVRQMLARLRLGESDRDIAGAQQVGRKSVARVRKLAQAQGWLDAANALPEDAQLALVFKSAPKRARNVSSVTPYASQVLAWHAQGIQASTILQALKRNHGFSASLSAIYRFLHTHAPAEVVASVMLEFAVGECAQVDFGQGPLIALPGQSQALKSWIFVMTLAWSRHQYAEVVRDQKVETWLGCHRRAFEWFNGVPAKLLIDNPKCAITRACYYEPEAQRSYAELALGYGFKISACPPRDPKKKGRVEAGVKYLKANFVPLREFRDLADANTQLQAWILGEAGNRIHGSTRARPLSLFSDTERAMLQPLPAIAPECAVWAKAKVHGNGHVQFERSHYSVPFELIRQTLWLQVGANMVRIYHGHLLVACHPRQLRPGAHATVADHLPPDAQAYLMRDPQWCLTQACAVGAQCLALVERLFSHKVLDHLRAAQGVLRLRESFGAARLEAACARALHFDCPSYRTVKQILKEGLDQQQLDLALGPVLEPPYLGANRFSRTPPDTLH
jgi:Integrase core domain